MAPIVRVERRWSAEGLLFAQRNRGNLDGAKAAGPE